MLTDLRKEFQTVNLKICDRKCEMYLPLAKENNVNRFSVSIVSTGVDILGCLLAMILMSSLDVANQRLQVKAFVLNCST